MTPRDDQLAELDRRLRAVECALLAHPWLRSLYEASVAADIDPDALRRSMMREGEPA